MMAIRFAACAALLAPAIVKVANASASHRFDAFIVLSPDWLNACALLKTSRRPVFAFLPACNLCRHEVIIPVGGLASSGFEPGFSLIGLDWARRRRGMGGLCRPLRHECIAVGTVQYPCSRLTILARASPRSHLEKLPNHKSSTRWL